MDLSFPQSVFILADETAGWNVGGLRQIDRLSLALNDFFQRSDGAVPVFVGGAAASLPSDPRLTNLKFASDVNSLRASDVLVISTRLVPGRTSLECAFENSMARRRFPGLTLDRAEIVAQSADDTKKLTARLRAVENSALNNAESVDSRDWSYLHNRSDVARCAAHLFRSTGKPQDGLISRYINRPLSRTLSRLLVRLPVSPNQLTLLLMMVPVFGASFLIHGDYLGFAIGAILFQLHSALDGCDGEVARVKYLESPFGSKLDAVCDRLSTLLFAVSLGFGLSRFFSSATGPGWIYFAEGIGAAALIGITETLLTRTAIEAEAGNDRYSSYVADHRMSFNDGDQLKLWMIKRSGMLSLGNGAASFFGELTKRDVFNFVFMLLAVCGFAQWVLHILAISACAILVLALKDILAPDLDVKPAS